MKNNEYKCASCQNIYEKGWSDEEAEKEQLEVFGYIPLTERAVICDDCFNQRSPVEIKEMGKEYQGLTPPEITLSK
jgi:hypothetical protein